MGELRLAERDYRIFREIERWRVCRGRNLVVLAEFSGQRACDRRLKRLIEAGFITRKKILYGVPNIYANSHKTKVLTGLPLRADKIKVEQIGHDIAVLDTAIYIHKKAGTPFEDMTTEKQLHKIDGFGVRKHRPDFVFTRGNKTYCVEVELSLKAKDRLEKIIKDNFREYDKQMWVVPDLKSKIARILEQSKVIDPNIKIIELSEVKKHE